MSERPIFDRDDFLLSFWFATGAISLEALVDVWAAIVDIGDAPPIYA